MQKRTILQKKRTNVIAFVQEQKAIMEGINAGLADIKAGRVRSHEEVMAHIHETLKRLRKKNG